MAKVVRIFVEGDADVKFISDYILHIKQNTEIKIDKKKIAEIYYNEAIIATFRV